MDQLYRGDVRLYKPWQNYAWLDNSRTRNEEGESPGTETPARLLKRHRVSQRCPARLHKTVDTNRLFRDITHRVFHDRSSMSWIALLYWWFCWYLLLEMADSALFRKIGTGAAKALIGGFNLPFIFTWVLIMQNSTSWRSHVEKVSTTRRKLSLTCLKSTPGHVLPP